MHAGGVNIELEACSAQALALLLTTHLPAYEGVVHTPALLIILYHVYLTHRIADWPVL